ncbi:MAG: virulence protein RhuM/Fic/DOC family protein [Rhodocyclaceae bacterium]|nr:virulence protein RhuM/Fic/DOC family protein [Rhodocyclaceae bacterium]MCB1913206.1 virulence protein RhuM/Fic/DOC family protein [Rhodocyclaceae bacterium]MCP5252906.1 virulence protein RhuM/Fic/DOC family protein [Zoogloeaceae bacterium]MCP5293172.1 virulence protein RhuM/Fic/DOC family protein [Zoogloeaceae bacterium]
MDASDTNEILIYKAEDGSPVTEVRLAGETVWLRQEQMAQLFGRERSVITRHVGNVFREGELDEESNVQNVHIAGSDKPVKFYNLDVIISVGYRVKSPQGTRFRQWATRTLREHLTQGYTLNRQRFEANARELEAALQLVKKAAQSPELLADTGRGLVDIVTRYAQTFLLLQRYDEGLLAEPREERGGVLPTSTEARTALARLKADLIARGEATDLFARERNDAFAALLGNLDQTVFGEPAYPSVEAKAAHLLYFVIKNHPFSDGNKRSGAFLFVDFLNRNGRLLDDAGQPVINDIGLAALALLVAESNPANKETMIRLIMNMLSPEAPRG